MLKNYITKTLELFYLKLLFNIKYTNFLENLERKTKKMNILLFVY